MIKRIVGALVVVIILCTACGSEESNLVKTDSLVVEIPKVLEQVSYDNLEILFDNIKSYEEQEIVIATTNRKSPSEGLSYEDAVTLYVDRIIPNLLDMEKVDTEKIYDINTRSEEGAYRIRTYKKDYQDVLATIDEYEYIPHLVYANNETWTELYYTGDWLSGVYLTQGKLGSIVPSMSAFGAYRVIEDVKEYDCRMDDLSDSYLLMDGEKTVLKAKQEIEEYLDAHYPLTEEDNEIRNEVYKIIAGKITGTEYYAFRVYRTLNYNGISIREMPSTQSFPNDEMVFLGEGAMCESKKLDITIGLINCYEKPEVERVITEVISFQEVMDRVAYYLTGETKFQLMHGSLEYRMFVKEDGYQLVPYWCFIAKNPNDDSTIKIYVDMETGEIEHFIY
ncbi:MAG: hypothetical protein IJE49_08160 [Agathobacter sp.]|nr:hypothetical protein [Agathobacter sp.]